MKNEICIVGTDSKYGYYDLEEMSARADGVAELVVDGIHDHFKKAGKEKVATDFFKAFTDIVDERLNIEALNLLISYLDSIGFDSFSRTLKCSVFNEEEDLCIVFITEVLNWMDEYI